jgi:hypothetical protein
MSISTVNHLCHMVLALKPFGYMPSTQSDGVQSRVVNKFKDMIFLPIEIPGEGEVNAHSPVADGASRRQSQGSAEFDGVLEQAGKSLDDLRGYVEEHPVLKQALCKVSHRKGTAGTAAQPAWHVSDLMDKDSAYRTRSSVSLAAQRSRDTGAFLSPSRTGSFKENRDEAVFGCPRRQSQPSRRL